MTTAWPRPVFCIGALVGMAVAIPALAMEGHTMLAPEQIAWKPAPAALPQGAEAAVLYGDPAQEGPFALRVRFPPDYSVPPHTHPVDEVLTVLSGTFHLGMGETADRNKAQPLPAGSFVAMAPGTAHYVFTNEATVIQINTVGPWGLTYINPADDPRQKSQ